MIAWATLERSIAVGPVWVGLVIVTLGGLLVAARRSSAGPPVVAALLGSVASTPSVAAEPELDGLAERHQAAVAPDAVEWGQRFARVDDQWTRTLYIGEFPDRPADGFLSGLFELSAVTYDLTIQLRPRDPDRARRQLRASADDLRAEADLEQSVRESHLQARAREARQTYQAVASGERVFSQALFLTVRAESRAALDQAVERVQARLREPPARCEPRSATCLQRRALEAAAPFGDRPLDRSVTALGGAVGALLASPQRSRLAEPGGIELGRHVATGRAVAMDPFARPDGYAWVTVGDPGSGKSFAAKQQFLRALGQDPDRIGVILEPLNDWAGVAEALDGRRITVGGNLGLNPLEIRPTPPAVLRARGADADPLNERRQRAIAFFTNVFATRGVELGDRRPTLELAVRTAYRRQGITADVSTHANESPTVRDLLDVLAGFASDPAAHVCRSEAEAQKLAGDAVWLLDQLRLFDEGGRFEHLGRASEFDLREASVVYLDLVQQAGQLGGHTSLVMELLISLVYERAKQSAREMVFVIDEARYLFHDRATLSFLETIFRHHRHHDLSIRLVTQTLDEFLNDEIASIVLDQCAIKQLHKLDGIDERVAEAIGLSDAQLQFVQEAVPGDDSHGHAQALLGVDGEWRGVEIEAFPYERRVIDHDPRDGELGVGNG